jgi:hypothetical protein
MQGLLNTTALSVPGLYIVLIPQQLLLNGVPSNIVGAVGVASWGPVNSPMPVGNPGNIGLMFGKPALRQYDLSTHLVVALQQGGSVAYGVRVSDGTDTAATATLVAASIAASFANAVANAVNNGISQIRSSSNLVVASVDSGSLIVAAKYTGSLGNALGFAVVAGTKPNTVRVVVTLGSQQEVFDNIAGNGTDAVPASASLAFTGGTDGAAFSGLTQAQIEGVLLGTDGSPRTGLYTLRGKGCTAFTLADVTGTTTWASQASYALSEASYGIVVGPAGQSITAAVAAKNTAGIDTPWLKVVLGDWAYWNDTYNQVPMRLVSPAAHFLGQFGILAPQESSLNKQFGAVVATQTSNSGLAYSNADLTILNTNGLDAIIYPCPGGNHFGGATGLNASSNAAVNGDNWTRMTSFICSTLNGGLGKYVGTLQSSGQRRKAKATLDAFFAALETAGMIGTADGSLPFATELDDGNNNPALTALGYENAYAQVTYLSVTRFFILSLEAGQTVAVVDPSQTFSLAA